MTTFIRIWAVSELTLSLMEATGQFGGIVPLTGSHIIQDAIVLSVVALLSEVAEIMYRAAKWLSQK